MVESKLEETIFCSGGHYTALAKYPLLLMLVIFWKKAAFIHQVSCCRDSFSQFGWADAHFAYPVPVAQQGCGKVINS